MIFIDKATLTAIIYYMTDTYALILIFYLIIITYPLMSKGVDMMIKDFGIVLKTLLYGIIAIIAFIIRRVR